MRIGVDDEEIGELAVYGTGDPNTILVEYELLDSAGRDEPLLCVAVLEVRADLMRLWCAYQD